MAKNDKRRATHVDDNWLFEGEEVVHGWRGINVTTHRVRYEVTGSGEHALVSLLHGQIDGTAFRRVHFPWLLALAALFALLGVVGFTMHDGTTLTVFGFVLAVLCVAAYLATRKVAVIIAAGSMRIEQTVPGGGSHAAEAQALLQAIEEACARIQGERSATGARAA